MELSEGNASFRGNTFYERSLVLQNEVLKSNEIAPEAINRLVAVEGRYLGRELGMFTTHSLTEPMLGNDKFTEVYFKTESGNEYRIFEDKTGQWLIMDARSNDGKGFDQARGHFLSEQDIENGLIQIGQPFSYGQGGRTTKVAEITCVNGNRVYRQEELKKITEGASSVRQNFFGKIAPPQPK